MSRITILMKHVYGLIIFKSCSKMYNIIFNTHEYNMDYLIHVCRQF